MSNSYLQNTVWCARSGTQCLYLGMQDLAHKTSTWGCQVRHTRPLHGDARSGTQDLYMGMPDLALTNSTWGCQVRHTRPLPGDARSGTQAHYPGMPDLAYRPTTQRCQIWHIRPLQWWWTSQMGSHLMTISCIPENNMHRPAKSQAGLPTIIINTWGFRQTTVTQSDNCMLTSDEQQSRWLGSPRPEESWDKLHWGMLQNFAVEHPAPSDQDSYKGKLSNPWGKHPQQSGDILAPSVGWV